MISPADLLSSSALRYPNAAAFQFDDQRIGYAQFSRDIAAVAGRIVAGGVRPGEIVGVFIGQPAEHWCVLLALLRVGAVSVSLTSRHEAEVDALPDLTTIIFSGDKPPACSRPVRFLPIAADWLEPKTTSRVPLPSVAEADASAGRICFTSGSAGKPKAILLDSARLGIRLSRTAERSRLNARSVLWCGLGPDSAYGYTATLAAWIEGGMVAFARKRDDLKDYLLASNVNVVISSASALHAILNTPSSVMSRFDGPTIVAGSPLSPDLRARLLRDFCSEVLVAYGSSETGGITLVDAAAIDEHPGTVGTPFSDVQVEIVDNDVPLPTGVAGQVRIKSRSQASSYLNDPLSTAVHFRGGWFYPGDVAKKTPTGSLTLLARESDTLNLDGVKYSGSDIDAFARRQPDIHDAVAVPLVDLKGRMRLGIAVVASEEAAGALPGAIRSAMPHLPRLSLVRVSSIPRSSMGKVNRIEFGRLLSEMLASREQESKEIGLEIMAHDTIEQDGNRM